MCTKLRPPQKISLNPVRRPLENRAKGLSLWKRLAKSPVAMSDQFLVFEKVLKKRRRTWKWRVCTPEGDVVMHGSASSRPAAGYQADRALFLLLLSAPYQSIRLAVRAEAASDLPFWSSPGSRQLGKIWLSYCFSLAGVVPRAEQPKAAGSPRAG